MARKMTKLKSDYTPEDPKERDRSGREARRLWYRAPELLFRKASYTQEIDMWSVGCILAELATSTVLFDGDSEIEQFLKIFSLLGTPTDTINSQNKFSLINQYVLPDWKSIKLTDIFYDPAKIISRLLTSREKVLFKLLELRHTLGYQGLDLLEKLLDINS